jgi:hypothetical protein
MKKAGRGSVFAFKPDYERARQRIDAFWERELVDRPVVQFTLSKPPEEWMPLTPSHHSTPADLWLNAGYQAELALANLSNQEFLGDTMPVAWPNLGPDLFAALYGCPLRFGPLTGIFGGYDTSWSESILPDWAAAEHLALAWDGFYMRKLIEIVRSITWTAQARCGTWILSWPFRSWIRCSGSRARAGRVSSVGCRSTARSRPRAKGFR